MKDFFKRENSMDTEKPNLQMALYIAVIGKIITFPVMAFYKRVMVADMKETGAKENAAVMEK